MRTLRLYCCVAILVALLCACAREPTPIDVPSGALSVERFPLAIQGGAFQTQFTLQATYPATPALDFYRAHLAKPWVLCEWSDPEWKNFTDATGKTTVGVHQLLYMWVNREANRTLMFSMRYYSAPDSHAAPDNDSQRIVLVEYMAPDIPSSIKDLRLRCPGDDVAVL